MKKTITLLILVVIALTPFAHPPSVSAQLFADDQQQKFTRQILKLDGEEITVIRDNFGVPHIFAATERGAYYGGGYAVAQDRLYQLERFRRDARGEVAEIEGRPALTRDAITRSFIYTEPQLLAGFESLKNEVKESYTAYAEGINAYMKEVTEQRKLPEAFSKAGIGEPAQWKVTDSVAIAVMMAKRFGSIGGGEPLNARILKKLKEKFGDQADGIFNDLFWLNDPRSPVSVPGGEKSEPADPKNRNKAVTLRLDRLNDSSLEQAYEVAAETSVVEYAQKHGLPAKWGSYAWAISPALTVSGSAILVGGPQMGFSTPQIAHEIHYSAGAFNVIGMAIAGLPVVFVGHNDDLAWTMTSGLSDMVDIFAERLNPKNKYQYLYKGSYRDMEMRVETVKIKDQKPVPIHLYRTVHGPVVAWDEQAGIAYSSAASYRGHEIKTLEAFYGFNHAKDLTGFAKSAELIYTNHNLIAATSDGDIGYWHCGKPPIRARGYDLRLPPLGTGEYDWQGVMPFSKMPQVINPPQGFLVSWNNKPARWWDNGDFPVWGEIYHVHRLERLIKAQSKLTFEQVRDFNVDIATNEHAADYIKPYLLASISKAARKNGDKRIIEAAGYLQFWNNHAEDGSVGKTIFDAWYQEMLDATFGETLKEVKALIVQSGSTPVYNLIMQPSLLLHVLDGKKSGLPPSRDYFNGKSRDEVIVEALVRALDTLAGKRGPQMNLWTYNQGSTSFAPLPGIPSMARGTYIQVTELSKPLFRSVNILPPGQSEDFRSAHYRDQREMAGFWRFKPMLYKREQLEKFLDGAK